MEMGSFGHLNKNILINNLSAPHFIKEINESRLRRFADMVKYDKKFSLGKKISFLKTHFRFSF